jgi:glycosyltransferase involved in cell wall biosynthesis
MNSRIGVLIPTRNRPEEVSKLLSSLVGQEVSQVVVSASGQDINHIISNYKDILNLIYVQSDPGQINQKINGIREFSDNVDWIIFSDDDLIYPGNFFSKFIKFVELSENRSVIGVGFKLGNTIEKRDYFPKKIIKKLFLLQSGRPGFVSKSGECIRYCYGQKQLSTNWLNGASAWKVDQARQYTSVSPDTKYAAYEDAIYSHEMSKQGKLIYSPELQVHYQDSTNLTKLTSLAFLSYSTWKMYFVIKNKLSLTRYTWSTLGLTLIFLCGSDQKLKSKVKTISTLWVHLIRVLLSGDYEKQITNIIANDLPKA